MAFYLAFKEIWRHRGRYFLIGLVIALITTLVLFIAALAEGLGLGNREYIEKLNAELLLYQENVDFSIPSSRLGRSRLNDVRRVEGVEDVGQVGFAAAALVRPDQEWLDVSLIGVEPGRPGEPPALEGQQLQSKRGKEVIIDRTAAQQTGLRVGDMLTIKTIQGTEEKLHTLQLVGISDNRRYSIQPSIFVPFLTWEEIRPRASVESTPGRDLIANVIAVKLVDPASRDLVAERIAQQVDDVEAATL
jgi:putative ABC transport system permease protein